MALITVALILGIAVAAYSMGRRRALRLVGGEVAELNSLPGHYGGFASLWAAIPALIVLAGCLAIAPQFIEASLLDRLPAAVSELPEMERKVFLADIGAIQRGDIPSQDTEDRRAGAAIHGGLLAASNMFILGLCAGLALVCALGAYLKIHPRMRARNHVEAVLRGLLMLASGLAVLTTIGIVLSLVFESARFFARVPIMEFLVGLEWSPQTAIREDQVGSAGNFGAIPLFAGTMLITLIAMLVAAPLGLFSAVFLSDYATARFRAIAKPLLEILAGIPTVVYGFFAALTVAPFIRGFGESLGLDVASESALAAGVVMGIMIIPFVSSLSDDVINAVPQSLRDGSYGMGATKSETIWKVVLPAALPGIVSALLLATSRAIGETMIVVMAAGLAANLTANPLEAVTTVTVQMVTLLIGDQEFDSAKTLAAFALGLVLFCITLALNIIALRVVQKYREQYD